MKFLEKQRICPVRAEGPRPRYTVLGHLAAYIMNRLVINVRIYAQPLQIKKASQSDLVLDSFLVSCNYSPSFAAVVKVLKRVFALFSVAVDACS